MPPGHQDDNQAGREKDAQAPRQYTGAQRFEQIPADKPAACDRYVPGGDDHGLRNVRCLAGCLCRCRLEQRGRSTEGKASDQHAAIDRWPRGADTEGDGGEKKEHRARDGHSPQPAVDQHPDDPDAP